MEGEFARVGGGSVVGPTASKSGRVDDRRGAESLSGCGWAWAGGMRQQNRHESECEDGRDTEGERGVGSRHALERDGRRWTRVQSDRAWGGGGRGLWVGRE